MRRGRRAVVVAIAFTLAWLAWSPAHAHSIPSHKNITRAAVAWLLEAQPRLQCSPQGKQALTDLLLVGTEHEDDNYNDNEPLKMGRYMFHFYPALDDSFAVVNIAALSVPEVSQGRIVLWSLELGVFRALNACSSLVWGGFARSTPGNVECAYNALRANTIPLTNVNTWGNALDDAKKGVMSRRAAGFSEGFVKLGYLIHLVQDQTSPAHAMNASHGHKPMPVDLFAHLDPNLKGKTVDFGFPDQMEVDLAGKDAARDIPPSAWPARDARQLIDKAPADILTDMHNLVRTKGYARESMHARTARMARNVVQKVEGKLPDIVKGLGWPWPIGKETAAQELQDLKRRVATIVHEEMVKEADTEMRATVAKAVEADREWAVLGPEAVRHSASLLWRYIDQARPAMGQGAPAGGAACTLKP